MALIPDSDLTRDAFLGDRLQLWQPVQGYRAGVDPVLLAAAVPARSGQHVLELGCGTGAALLCLGARCPGLDLTGVEINADYADLAVRNAADNEIAATIIRADIRELPKEMKGAAFDHVIANPPYFGKGTAARDPGRQGALAEDMPLAIWIDTGLRRLRPRGQLTFILRADRLVHMLSALGTRVGAVVVLPVAPRPGRDASLIIVCAVKGSRAGSRLLSPFVLHEGAAHLSDGEDYTTATQRVLRDSQSLPLGLHNYPQPKIAR